MKKTNKQKKIILKNIKTNQRNFEKLSSNKNVSNINDASNLIVNEIKNGNKIMFCGNGGSAADAQHLSAELVGKYLIHRNPLPAICLSTNTSTLTSIANDLSYSQVFSRQVKAFGKEGDILFGISTSGKSPADCRRIREYIESRFCQDVINCFAEKPLAPKSTEKTSEGREQAFNSKLPYPIGFLLTNRQCITIGKSSKLSIKINLLRKCGAKVKMENDNTLKLNSSAFLTFADVEHQEYCGSQLVELTRNPMRGTFYTPLAIIDRGLVIGITPNLDSKNEWEYAKQIQIDLSTQFENQGYGHFLDFLGSLRPQVMNSIPTTTKRKKFFEDIIDQNSKGEKERCCFDFSNSGCANECTFNLVRTHRTNQIQKEIQKKIQTYSYN